jgi:hypothetical protein
VDSALKEKVLQVISQAENDPEQTVIHQLPVPMDHLNPHDQSDRLTIRLNIYYEHFGDEPIGHEVIANKLLETLGVEPFIRKFVATEDPKPLKLGDIDRNNIGYILIFNLEGLKLQQNPSEKELADIKKRVAIIDGFEIYPCGMPFLGMPRLDQPLMVHCQHGSARLQTYIFPR